MTEMPVLTVKQPWAWAIVHGGKAVENRGWNMTYRGPLWLQAGARSGWDPDGGRSRNVLAAWDRWRRTIPDWPGLPVSDVELGRKTTLMPFGAVVAMAEVTGCHWCGKCWDLTAEKHCSPWASYGQYHIELANVRALPEPVPCRGMLGLWRLPDEVEKTVREQVQEQHRGGVDA